MIRLEPHPSGDRGGRREHPVSSKWAPCSDQLPFPEASFDLVAALDVLEHVDDDVGALDALIRLVGQAVHH